jgi:hypothetical protein
MAATNSSDVLMLKDRLPTKAVKGGFVGYSYVLGGLGPLLLFLLLLPWPWLLSGMFPFESW